MDSVSEAGLCGHSGYGELLEGEACVYHRSPLADGEHWVWELGEVDFDTTVALERLCCQGVLVLGQFRDGGALCYHVEFFS